MGQAPVHPCISTATSKHYPTFVLRLADDDESAAAADENISSTTEELLKELNDKFDYEGRMPMGSNSVVVVPTPTAAAIPQAAITDFRCGFVVVLGAPNMGTCLYSSSRYASSCPVPVHASSSAEFCSV
jgi:hypothetical protein